MTMTQATNIMQSATMAGIAAGVIGGAEDPMRLLLKMLGEDLASKLMQVLDNPALPPLPEGQRIHVVRSNGRITLDLSITSIPKGAAP